MKKISFDLDEFIVDESFNLENFVMDGSSLPSEIVVETKGDVEVEEILPTAEPDFFTFDNCEMPENYSERRTSSYDDYKELNKMIKDHFENDTYHLEVMRICRNGNMDLN